MTIEENAKVTNLPLVNDLTGGGAGSGKHVDFNIYVDVVLLVGKLKDYIGR